MFYIVWGTKVYQKHEGFAADFCPICRQAAIVAVRGIYSQSHVYHIGIGKGKLSGRLCQCATCKSEWAFRAGTIETPINSNAPLTLETLLAETYPRFNLLNAERLEQENIIRTDPFALDEKTRLKLLVEPFLVLNNDVERDENKDSLAQFVSGVGILGALIFFIVAVVHFFSGEPLAGFGWLVGAIVGAVLTGKFMSATTRKYMRRQIYPRLAYCLAPLKPTNEELAAITEGVDCKCAKQTKLEDFLPYLEQSQEEAANRAGFERETANR